MKPLLLVFLAAGALCGCATGITLTTRGARVQNVGLADMPTGCEVLGDVPIGIPPDAARPHSEEELVILMRNKAGELGGNYVLVDSSDRRTGPANEVFWVGRGRAYHCQEHEGVDPIHAPGEGAAEGTAGGEGAAAAPIDDETPH
jgi:hypothetical protein